LTANATFHKATKLTEFAKTETNTSISDAFRTPSSQTTTKDDGLRMRVRRDQPLVVKQIQPKGWAAVVGWLFPNATVVEFSGKFEVTLHIYPSHIQVQKRRWFSKSSVLARFEISIPVFDEIGDTPTHVILVKSALAFLYPFVPMHVQVSVDNVPLFAQGKFDESARQV
jgi:hypothetical protein